MKTENVVLGIALAAVAGIAVGMLFAPEKGERTRRKIKEKGEDLLDDLQHDYDRSVKQIKRKVETAYENLSAEISQSEVPV
ncbi:YtxH domain-containing protein [Telluribacter sp. SYSU D00476]|uniref:YtxH domain-containing protein n=1 Tax=Telluribacter sp. SYSU D00476 TaxID=2811430 RepID=UPI001FF5F71F|nr:YtxH domain-containing protein [Telluribacter sp. SYSU D00476]